MLFANPAIIRNHEDVIIGSVEVPEGKASYLNYKLKVHKKILKLVVAQVKQSMSNGATHELAIQETADIVYSYLGIEKGDYPDSEEGIVSLILSSAEYKNWDTTIYYRFMDTHTGVTTTETPITAAGTNPLQDEIDLDEADFYDLLQALGASFNL